MGSNTVQIFRKLLKGETVKIFVGKEKEEFTIHKDLLCEVSPFFDKAFNGHFKEATSKEMNLSHISSQVFSEFLTWIYTKELPEYHCHQSEDAKPKYFLDCYNIDTLIDLYIFSTEILCYQFSNIVIDFIPSAITPFDYCCEKFTLDHVKKVFESTPDDSKSGLRDFCVAYLAWRLHYGLENDYHYPSELENLIHEYPEILLKLLNFQWKITRFPPKDCQVDWNDLYQNPLWFKAGAGMYPRCYFHSHEAGESCEKAKDGSFNFSQELWGQWDTNKERMGNAWTNSEFF